MQNSKFSAFHNVFKFFSVIFIFFLVPSKVSAQVVINELSTNTSSDWIEIYAFEDTDISGWALDDYDTSTNLKEFPVSTVIGPSTKPFLSIDVGNRLNNSGDIVTLFNANSEKVDEVTYGDKGGVCIPSDAGSVGRVDNGNTIERFALSTKELSNAGSQLESCPTPSPEPTNTPTPTPKPTKTPTPIPTSTPTPSPKATATKVSTPKPTVKAVKAEDDTSNESETSGEELGEKEVLGVREVDLKDSPTSEESGGGDATSKKFPWMAGVLVVSGLGLVGLAFYPFLKNLKQKYNFKR